MVHPHPDSEKGISAYSLDLIKNIKKQKQEIEGITFMQGKPLSLFKKFSKLPNYDIVHIQHEYNLLGLYGIPYFFLFLFLGLFKKRAIVTTMHTVLSQQEKFKSFIPITYKKLLPFK